jgi:hypothetical protein
MRDVRGTASKRTIAYLRRRSFKIATASVCLVGSLTGIISLTNDDIGALVALGISSAAVALFMLLLDVSSLFVDRSLKREALVAASQLLPRYARQDHMEEWQAWLLDLREFCWLFHATPYNCGWASER